MTKGKFAALTAGLLARKGEAAPTAHRSLAAPREEALHETAHRRPPALKLGQPIDLAQLIERAVAPSPATLNAVVPPAPQPKTAPIPRPRPAPATHPPSLPRVFGLSHVLPEPRRTAEAAPVPQRTAVTVRLDEGRYFRLKVTGARFHRTNQDILTRALDAYLTALGIEEFDEDSAALSPAAHQHLRRR